jgi:hypothetical protein
MDDMLEHMETAYKLLYRWVKNECRGLDKEVLPDLSLLLVEAFTALQERTVLLRYLPAVPPLSTFRPPPSALCPLPSASHPPSTLRPPPSTLRPPPSALRPPPSALRPPPSASALPSILTQFSDCLQEVGETRNKAVKRAFLRALTAGGPNGIFFRRPVGNDKNFVG